MPDNGNVWRKYRVVPRAYPSHPLICAYFDRAGNKERFRLPGAGGEHFHCTVDPSPGHIRCRNCSDNMDRFVFVNGMAMETLKRKQLVSNSSVQGQVAGLWGASEQVGLGLRWLKSPLRSEQVL